MRGQRPRVLLVGLGLVGGVSAVVAAPARPRTAPAARSAEAGRGARRVSGAPLIW